MRSGSHDCSENIGVLILRQQELAAKLARNGKTAKARAARSKLLTLLNQRDMSQSLLIKNEASDGGEDHESQP